MNAKLFPNDFAFRIAQELLGSGVPGFDQTVERQRDDGIIRRLNQRCQARGYRTGRMPGRDILDNRHEIKRYSVDIAHERRRRANPNDLAITVEVALLQ